MPKRMNLARFVRCWVFAGLVLASSSLELLNKSRGLECYPDILHPRNASGFCRSQLRSWIGHLPILSPLILSTDPSKATRGFGTVPQYLIDKQRQNVQSITSCEITIERYRKDETAIHSYRRAQLDDDTTNADEIEDVGDRIIDECLDNDLNGRFPLGKKDIWVLHVVGAEVGDDG